MAFLGPETKREIFTKAIGFGVTTNRTRTALHDICSSVMGRPMWWTQNDVYLPTEGTNIQLTDDEYQITTASVANTKKKDIPSLAYAYVHEVGHAIYHHFCDDRYLFQQYTWKEAEADAFAFSYLYVTANTGLPNIGSFSTAMLMLAIKNKNDGRDGFYWSQSLRNVDVGLIRSIRKREENK